MGFNTFLGNPKAVEMLRDLLRADRLPGALLLTGPEGVGKKTLALMLARALNCERASDDFCGECRACKKSEEMIRAAREDLERRREIKDAQRRVDGLVYFDVQLIEPITRFILIEQIRQLRQIAYTRPFELRRRVFVVDSAQAVHWQAVDLLLKVLEEPPATTTLILVCPNAFELRPTLRSRCLRIAFAPVEQSVIERVIEEEGKVGKAQRGLAARVAAGSVARARTFDAGEYQRRRKPWLDFLEVVARRAPSPGDWKTLFDSTRALGEKRDELAETLRIGLSLLRDLALALEGGPERETVNVDVADRLKAWASALGYAGIERLKSGLDQAYRLQSRNINPQLNLDSLALETIARQDEPAR
jgi:DNA polymerase-3 subunit delta'